MIVTLEPSDPIDWRITSRSTTTSTGRWSRLRCLTTKWGDVWRDLRRVVLRTADLTWDHRTVRMEARTAGPTEDLTAVLTVLPLSDGADPAIVNAMISQPNDDDSKKKQSKTNPHFHNFFHPPVWIARAALKTAFCVKLFFVPVWFFSRHWFPSLGIVFFFQSHRISSIKQSDFDDHLAI